jgi:hypothetical protein
VCRSASGSRATPPRSRTLKPTVSVARPTARAFDGPSSPRIRSKRRPPRHRRRPRRHRPTLPRAARPLHRSRPPPRRRGRNDPVSCGAGQPARSPLLLRQLLVPRPVPCRSHRQRSLRPHRRGSPPRRRPLLPSRPRRPGRRPRPASLRPPRLRRVPYRPPPRLSLHRPPRSVLRSVRRASRSRLPRARPVPIPDVPFRHLRADVPPLVRVAPADLLVQADARRPADDPPRAAPRADPVVALVDDPAVVQVVAVASAAAGPAVDLLPRDCAAGRAAVAVPPSDALVVGAATSKSSSRPRPLRIRRRMRRYPTLR